MRKDGMTVGGVADTQKTKELNFKEDDKKEALVAFNPLKEISVFWNAVTNPASTSTDSNNSGSSSYIS